MTAMSVDLVVVGAGVTGLACATEARRRRPGARVLCLEARGRPGGTVRTVAMAGFVLEGGPSGYLAASDVVGSLAASAGLPPPRPAGSAARRRAVRLGADLHPLPHDLPTLLASAALGPLQKLRLLLEPLLPHGSPPPATVAELARRRLGSAGAFLLEPLVPALLGGEANTTAVEALPQLAAGVRARRSLLRALLASSGRPFLSWTAGMEELVRGLAVSAAPVLGCRVTRVTPDRGGFTVAVEGAAEGSVHAGRVVLAVPAWQAAGLLERASAEAATALGRLRHVPVVSVALGLAESAGLGTFGGWLVPLAEGSPVLGVVDEEALFPGARAPAGGRVVRVLLGGERAPELIDASEGELLELAGEEVRRVLGGPPEVVAHLVARHRAGFVVVQPGHHLLVEQVEDALRFLPGLELAGAGLRGTSLEARVADARRLGAA